jgi:hypothetical protein
MVLQGLVTIDGSAVPAIYIGGNGRGDQTITQALIVVDGTVAPSFYSGGIGRGDQSISQPLIVVDGKLVPSLYAGGMGRGDQNISQPLVVIDGATAPAIYAGGNGRGDLGTDMTLSVISGAAIPDIYQGGIGRGDFATEGEAASLLDCNEFIGWTGAINNNWHNAANWSCGEIPGPQHKVYIPEGRPRYPNINGTVSILRLELQPNAMVGLLQNARLIITGTEQ